MPSDAKKILHDLENGTLPDIKKNSGNSSNDLTRIRYNRSNAHSKSIPISESIMHNDVPRSVEHKKLRNYCGGDDSPETPSKIVSKVKYKKLNTK